ncbi:hypothetical protein B7939_01310 [Eggerthia catenaformis]|nr:hypothetical protein B7939_01310 [Eggerthia catenaformis]
MTDRFASQKKYNKATLKRVSLDMNLNTDQDILAWLETKKSKAGYIKQLIREDMKKEQED